jgi:ribosome-binding factor A
MPREFSRTRRVAELVQRELAKLLANQINDPRIGFVTVTSVELSKDLKHAKVYVTRLNQEDSSASKEQLLTALTHASGFLRRELSHDLNLRVSPTFSFFYDTSIENGNKLSKLIESAVHPDVDATSKG